MTWEGLRGGPGGDLGQSPVEEPDWAGIEGQVEQGPVGDSTVTESDGKDAQEQRKTRGVQTPENSRTERVNRHSLFIPLKRQSREGARSVNRRR